MADKAKNVVLNFKMDGQVQYANTLKQINAVMNTAAKEYKNHITAMGQDAAVTEKLRAEKKKLEIQLEASQKKTKMLRDEYDAMSKDTKTTTEQLTKMYGRVLDAESAETKLQKSLERVNGGLTDQAQEARDAKVVLDGLKNESKLLEAEQKKLTSEFRLQNLEINENATEAEKLELAQRQLTSQMAITNRAVSNLESQLAAAKKVYGENSLEVKQLETKLNETRSSIKKFSSSLGDIEGSGQKAGDGMSELGKKMDLNNILEASEMLQGLSDKLIEIGENSIAAALLFGDSQSNLQANLGLTEEEAEKLNDVVDNVFRNGVVPSVEDATLAVTLTKQAFKDLNNVELEVITNKLIGISKRTGTDVQENINAASKLMMEFGLSGEAALDLIASGYQKNLNKSGDFTDTLNEYSPLFADAGFSADQMLGMLADGLEGGAMNTDKVADAVKELQIRFGDGSFEKNIGLFSKDTGKLFKQWQDGKVSMTDVMNSIQKDIKKMDSSKQQEALSALATQFEDLGIRGSISLLGVGESLDDASGKADDFAKKAPGEEWESSLRELQTTMKPIGKNLVDVLTPVIETLGKVSKWFTDLPGPLQTFITAFGGVITVIGILSPILTVIIGAFMLFGTTLLPFIGIVIGVAAAIAGIIVAIQNWGEITDWVSGKYNDFTKWLSKTTSKLVADFVKWFAEMKQETVNKFNEMKDGAVGKVTDLKNKATETVQSFKNNVFAKANELKTGFVNKISDMKQGAIDKVNGLKDGATSVIVGFKNNVVNKASELKTNFINTLSQLKSDAINRFNSLRDTAGNVMTQTKDKILSPLTNARDKISGIVAEIKGFFSGMKLSIPKISIPKLPKFTLSGEFSLKPPSVPKIGIKWNAQGAIFTRPTIFGEYGGRLQGGGEAGPEAAIPLNEENLGAIGRGIAKTMKGSGVTQHITIISPEPTSPSENARKMKQAARELAFEW